MREKKYRDALVIDALFVGGPGFPAGFTEAQYEEAVQHSIDSQYGFISATISNGPPEDTPEIVKQRMRDVNQYWKQQPERYLQVTGIDAILRAQEEGRLRSCTTFRACARWART